LAQVNLQNEQQKSFLIYDKERVHMAAAEVLKNKNSKKSPIKDAFLSKYINNSPDPIRNQLIIEYAPLIKYLAQKIAVRLPSNIDIDDLFSAGVIGLMDAIEKYDPSRENKFKTYAEFRIRGSILDELRNQDWVPRSVRESNKKEDRVKLELEHELGRPATKVEVAKKLEMPLNDYQEKIARTHVSLLSIEDLGGANKDDKKSLLECIENPNSKNPFVFLKNKGLKNIIVKFIEDLPEKQKLVISLYYYEDLNLKEIGRILDVTESRISQLHTQAVSKLKQKLKNIY
jgi:RNA polymerase sigma factor for flagellar operon FliA